ncbi:hypothetical protein AVEN_123090-1 [Araneus ventricosus]|uniref:Reverse transcriptase domain-containing protein n=1 Tax=Araneus ventricosus TaxID=182803 RepID=A0A4Y2RSF0_ARAVE|nr:hypothetical protein AVEN_123090-1 [Araneus ventricosus]
MENSEKGTPTEFGLKLRQKLYPKIAPRAAQIQPYQTLFEEYKFSQQEIDDIVKKVPIGKAPGYDGIDNIIVKTGKEEHNIKSYRPTSLLTTLGKLLEKLLLQRFNFQLKTNKLQHPPQYGFREGKSADDALLHVTSLLEQARRQEKHAVLISLDISGAFDSLQYSSIRDRFAYLSLFSNISETLLDTLRNRKVSMQTSERPVLWKQTQGCLQGSCSGPAFWNIVADEILSVQWRQGVHLQAFSDDFAFIITDNTREGLRKLSKLALDMFKEWADKNKLHVSMEKSSYVLFSKLSEKFQPFLLSHKHIHLRWLKAHVGYLGNECEDQLANEAITKGDPFLLPKPLYYLKAEIKSAALSIWQVNWDKGETGRSIHDIVPRVSNKPVRWNREEIMFVTGHGPFPSYLLRFNLRTHDNCSCGEKGDPIHYATKCPFTLFWHFQTPTVSLKLQWLKNILTYNFLRTRLRLLMRFICDENNLIIEDNN